MKLPDVNVLLYAANEACPEHEEARNWLESAFNDAGGVGLAWVALLGFIRLSTRRGIFPKPLAAEDAIFERFSGLRFDALGVNARGS